MLFRGENPANGALVDYWLGAAGSGAGDHRARRRRPVGQDASRHRSTQRASTAWCGTCAKPICRFAAAFGDDDDAPRRGAACRVRWWRPATYVVRLVAGGRTLEQKVEVREDPRIDVTPADRKLWTDAQSQAAALARMFASGERSHPEDGRHRCRRHRPEAPVARAAVDESSGLYGAISRWTGAPTKDQMSAAGLLPDDGEDAGCKMADETQSHPAERFAIAMASAMLWHSQNSISTPATGSNGNSLSSGPNTRRVTVLMPGLL